MMLPIRVLYLLWAGDLGGAERHVYDLVMALPPDRFAPTVCFLSRGNTYGELLARAGVPFVEMRLRRGYDFLGVIRFAVWLRKNRFDVVHDHISTPWARVAVGLSMPRPAIVYTEHNGALLLTANAFRRFWTRWSAQYTDRFVTVSQGTKALLSKMGVESERIEVIHNFVDSSRFRPLLISRACEVRRSLGFPDQSRLLIAIGHLDANKGFDRLILVLRSLLTESANVHLLIIGEGVLRVKLESEIANLRLQDRVHLLGHRSDIPDLLGAADVFVMSSHFESFGIVAAEAMMAGKPVVAPRIPGLNEVVESGKTGFLVEPDRLETEFPEAVARLLDNPELRIQMGQAGRQRALALFERERIVRRIIDVYEKMLNEKVTV